MRLATLSLSLLILTASFFCHADNARYRNAVQKALDGEPALCLGETRWPVIVAHGRDGWVTARMAALADAGLILPRRFPAEIRWQLTDYGRREFRQHHDFCYGRMRVKTIQSISIKENGNVAVVFTYDIVRLPLWARNRAVRVANNDVDNLIMGIDKVRWRADFAARSLQLINEPEQLDLLY